MEKTYEERSLIYCLPFPLECPFLLEEHEPLIVDLFLPIFSRREWRVPWNARGVYLTAGK